MSLFVSVASYRDPQLGDTIRDAIATAARPRELRFGVVWQHEAGEPFPLTGVDGIRVLDVPWQESHGCCWARAEAMRLYDGEDWFYQIDAHMRFAPGWDATLERQARATRAERPLLTALPPRFTPGAPLEPSAPTLMTFERFGVDGEVMTGASRELGASVRRPVRGRFVSAACLFAPGRFVVDVPYDPDMYFHGEETTLAIRAYTAGYDLYHPAAVVAWHQYNVGDQAGCRPTHADRDRQSVASAKLRAFLRRPWTGHDGCGTVRTFVDYERYAGLDFARRCASDATRRHELPPGREPAGWAQRVVYYTVAMQPARATLPPTDDGLEWWADLWDAAGRSLYSAAVPAEALASYRAATATGIMVEVASQQIPVTWRLAAHSPAENRWITSYEGQTERARAYIRCATPWGLVGACEPALAREGA